MVSLEQLTPYIDAHRLRDIVSRHARARRLLDALVLVEAEGADVDEGTSTPPLAMATALETIEHCQQALAPAVAIAEGAISHKEMTLRSIMMIRIPRRSVAVCSGGSRAAAPLMLHRSTSSSTCLRTRPATSWSSPVVDPSDDRERLRRAMEALERLQHNRTHEAPRTRRLRRLIRRSDELGSCSRQR